MTPTPICHLRCVCTVPRGRTDDAPALIVFVRLTRPYHPPLPFTPPLSHFVAPSSRPHNPGLTNTSLTMSSHLAPLPLSSLPRHSRPSLSLRSSHPAFITTSLSLHLPPSPPCHFHSVFQSFPHSRVALTSFRSPHPSHPSHITTSLSLHVLTPPSPPRPRPLHPVPLTLS